MGLDLAADLSMLFTHLDRPQTDISIQEKFKRVKALRFFQGFPDAEIWEIISAAVWQEIDQGEVIIAEDDLDDAFYILASGTVTVEKQGQHLGQLQEGDCFGEMGYLNKIKRTATVTAKTPVSAIKISATLLEQVSAECQVRFCNVFLRVLVDRLASISEVLVESQLRAAST